MVRVFRAVDFAYLLLLLGREESLSSLLLTCILLICRFDSCLFLLWLVLTGLSDGSQGWLFTVRADLDFYLFRVEVPALLIGFVILQFLLRGVTLHLGFDSGLMPLKPPIYD